MRSRAFGTALILAVLISSPSIMAAQVRSFIIPITGAQPIDRQSDHMTVQLQGGWLSVQDGFLDRLLSRHTKYSTLIESELVLFDGKAINASETFSNVNVPGRIGSSWSVNAVPLDNIPADAKPKLKMSLALYSDDNVQTALGVIDKSKGALGAALTSPATVAAMGYATAASNLFQAFFRTADTKYPFTFEGRFDRNNAVINSTSIMPHYLALVAPIKDNDVDLQNMTARDLTYDEENAQLRLKNQPLQGRTWAVLKVVKGDGYDIQQLLLGSDAAWSTLALANFIVIPTSAAGNKDQLITVAANQLKQLQNEIDLLKREYRFTPLERAVALNTFAERSLAAIKNRCASLRLSAADCPTTDLQQFIDAIGHTFALKPTTMPKLKARSLKLHTDLQKQKMVKLP
jgi:hypothetical protein